MRVLFAASEVAPYSKAGGLGDVAGALPAALAALGHDVLVVSPWYARLGGEASPLWVGDVAVPFQGGWSDVGVGTLEARGVRFAFVGHPAFARDGLYGYDDDPWRFALLSRAVPQVAARLGFEPDVVHANDWHTGHLPLVLSRGWHLPAGFAHLPSVFTVHNAQYQGESDMAQTLHWLRLPGDLAGSFASHFGRFNALKAGAGFATRVTTVSPTYAQELTQPEYGYGLDGAFRSLAGRLTGILNGLDVSLWDPANDPHLPAPYDARHPNAKAASQVALRERYGLEPGLPVIGVVSRLVAQKGIDLLLAAAPRLLEMGWGIVVLGTGERDVEAAALALAADAPGRVGVTIGFDEPLSRLVYAGSDALAMPSRFEPCGLSQMIAMRYGTLPIVRATGGLRDTVEHLRTGFVFEHATADGVAWAAAEAWAVGPGTDRWRAMQQAAMRQDHSWEASARRYAALYEAASMSVIPSRS